MKVIAKYRIVEVCYQNGEIATIECQSILDAIEFRTRFEQVIPHRERAVSDKQYLKTFYDYLKVNGYIEKEAYMKRQAIQRKAELCRELSKRWV